MPKGENMRGFIAATVLAACTLTGCEGDGYRETIAASDRITVDAHYSETQGKGNVERLLPGDAYAAETRHFNAYMRYRMIASDAPEDAVDDAHGEETRPAIIALAGSRHEPAPLACSPVSLLKGD